MMPKQPSVERGQYVPRISTTVVSPDPHEAIVEWKHDDKYRFYIKLPRYIANAIIADHTTAALVPALERQLEEAIRDKPNGYLGMVQRIADVKAEREAAEQRAAGLLAALREIAEPKLLPNEHAISYSGWGRQAIARAAIAQAEAAQQGETA